MHKLMNLEARPRPSGITYRSLPVRSIPQASAVGVRYFYSLIVSSLPLLTTDLLCFAVVAGLVSWLAGSGLILSALPFLMVAWIIVNYFHGLYPAIGVHPAEELRRCSISTSSVAVTTLAIAIANSVAASLVIAGVLIWIGLLVAIPLGRGAARILAGPFDFWAQPVLIVGDINKGAKLIREMQADRSSGFRPIGIVSEPASHWNGDSLTNPEDASLCVGTLEEAASIAALEGVYWAIVLSSSSRELAYDPKIESYLHNIPNRLYTIEDQHRKNGYEHTLTESSSFNS